MLPITSQPYRILAAERIRATRSLGRGLQPLVLNAVVQLAAFAVLLGCVFAVMEPVMDWVEVRAGRLPILVMAAVPGLMFAVPWLVLYFLWRRVWAAIIRRRVAALTPEPGDLVATLDDDGIRIEETGLASNWLAWHAITRLALVGDTLVVARGAFGLMVSLEAIGGRPALGGLVARVSPAALAASDRSVHDALA